MKQGALFEAPRGRRFRLPPGVIGLNPSTADHRYDDPTLARCRALAVRCGYKSLLMLNLFAFRSTDPAGLSSAADPVGPLNDEAIGIAAVKRLLTVAAWGAHPFAIERARVVAPQFSALFCLGLTKDGHPRHPLYVKADAPLIPFVT